ncbi:DrmB family protein [Janibacter sp. GS2]|uniref:DrmB family protein n=1 Tax=Janibacter sp. GS2 TaxID=3442646 RepID=UPI003EB99659
MTDFIHDEDRAPDALGDVAAQQDEGTKKNFARVGSQRPSALLYTYGPGSIIDLPHFTVMPCGYDEWERIYGRRDGSRSIHAPRLLQTVRTMLGNQVGELRDYPWAPKAIASSSEGDNLGVQSIVFPQWMRCTGCDRLAPISVWNYANERARRPDLAQFTHAGCSGRPRRGQRASTLAATGRKLKNQPVVTARYLLACEDGHLDEFPYNWWVHEGREECPKAEMPILALRELTSGRGANAVVECRSCGASKPMTMALGEQGRERLPQCRGRHPHLDGFEPKGCTKEARVMLVGASNLWFPAVTSIIVMPETTREDTVQELARTIAARHAEDLEEFGDNVKMMRRILRETHDISTMSDDEVAELIRLAREPDESEEDRLARKDRWDPIELLAPEWSYLQDDPPGERYEHKESGLTLSPRGVASNMAQGISRVLAVDRLRKVNAVLGFTRIDELDRINDSTSRLVQLSRNGRPKWTVATEDRGEGIFIQLDEDAVADWEARVEASDLWAHHVAAHERNFRNRYSETSDVANHEDRLKPPRYWLVHTLAHVLIRQMAMSSGYGGASISERVYAWKRSDDRDPAAGMIVCTTASDSDGTLGGLVRLSEEARLSALIRDALRVSSRCSSDPICASRTPQDPEDFLHGAACHCCSFVSETSCERGNRFLDRRFLLSLPGSDLGFFGRPDVH